MSKLGIELLSQKISDNLLVRDTIEAPEKFTDEEIGLIKTYRPTDIDYDTVGLPQEAFWYILQDYVAGFYVNIRFGKRYVPEYKKYSWYVLIEGKNNNGKFSFEETTKPSELPLDIFSGIDILRKYLNKYLITEQKIAQSITPTDDERQKYKKDLEYLQDLVSKSRTFLLECEPDLKINRIEKNIEELQKKYTTKGSDIKRIERKVEMIKKNKMMLDDAFYQLKMEISRLGK
jgi:hypothetical protein